MMVRNWTVIRNWVVVRKQGAHVGAPLRGRPFIETRPIIDVNARPSIHVNACPIIDENGQPIIDENGHPIISECDQQNDVKPGEPNVEKYGLHNQKYNVTIGILVDWFKTMTTNEYIRGVKQYGWKRFDGKLWQRNYYEHIVRSTEEYERIADYITDNPAKWQEDKFFK